MSGWIKIEKDLLTDPRFVRMAKAACESCNADVTHQRCDHHGAVTQVLGTLARLWIYADSHIREDDTLDLGPDEINEVVGFEGFAQLMPADWLQVINPHCVELIGFQEHNGAVAKKKAVTAKRVARHRINNVTQERSQDEPICNAQALPDQTNPRPDQTRPIKKVPTEPVAAATAVEAKPPDSKTESVQRVFNHWRDIHRKPRAQLDDKRRKLIRTALGAYSEADLCQAISGYLNSPHHMGQNERSTVYDDIGLLLRDAEHIDAGIRFHVEPPRTDLSAQTKRIVAATEDWVPPEIRHAAN